MQFVLRRHIVPIFSVPGKPFSQASIEGNNSVFARKFWNARSFPSVADIDRQPVWFNTASLHYTGYTAKRPSRRPRTPFLNRAIFLRPVRETDDGAVIDVMNEPVARPTNYINNFVLAEWNLDSEQLVVSIEIDQRLHQLVSLPFPINPNSQYRP